MINYIWSFILAASLIYSFFSGTAADITGIIFSSISRAVEIAASLFGIICFWSGIMEIAQKSGFTDLLCKFLGIFTKLLFPDVKKDSAAMRSITMNITANLLGLGNAATPFGLAAVNELDKENGYSSYSSNAMCMLVVINTASIQLLPTTIMGLNAAAGGQNPSAIIMPIWITSFLTLLIGVICAKICERRF